MKLTKGTKLKSKGGWDAVVVWVRTIEGRGFYAVHRPGEKDPRHPESMPIWHFANGTAQSQFDVGAPPCYGSQHPADLEMGEYEL